MKTSNPALNSRVFSSLPSVSNSMTIEGTISKTALLLFIAVVGAAWTWRLYYNGQTENWSFLLYGSSFGGLVVGFATIFKKTWAPYTAPLYAALEGLLMGAISASLESRFPGLVIQAVGLTFATLLCLLAAYRSGMIKPTEKFMAGVVAATGAIAIFYLLSIVLSFFHVDLPLMHSSGPIGIIFSLVVVAVAALNLVLDFYTIEEGAARGVPKYMEWYGAFSLLVTLVWLYMEVLRLLSKIRGRD